MMELKVSSGCGTTAGQLSGFVTTLKENEAAKLAAEAIAELVATELALHGEAGVEEFAYTRSAALISRAQAMGLKLPSPYREVGVEWEYPDFSRKQALQDRP